MARKTTCNMSGQPVQPEWVNSKGRAVCPVCGKTYMPTAEQLFRYHNRLVEA